MCVCVCVYVAKPSPYPPANNLRRIKNESKNIHTHPSTPPTPPMSHDLITGGWVGEGVGGVGVGWFLGGPKKLQKNASKTHPPIHPPPPPNSKN